LVFGAAGIILLAALTLSPPGVMLRTMIDRKVALAYSALRGCGLLPEYRKPLVNIATEELIRLADGPLADSAG
jgi:hypothetical protein